MSDMSPFAGRPRPDRAGGSALDRSGNDTPVCPLAALDPVEAATVMCLRRFREGGESALVSDFAAIWPEDTAAANRLADVFLLILAHGLRPMPARALASRLVGGDEACLGRLVSTAATGEAEDALSLALMLVRADRAPAAVASAQQAGLALRRAMLRSCAESDVVLH